MSFFSFFQPKKNLANGSPFPVWRDSVRKPVQFFALSKKTAVRLYHEARGFERQTRQTGKQDGALGRNGLAVLHALLFDFLNYKTGALHPSRATIAKAANISLRSVDRGLAALKAAGVLNWVRRCCEAWIDGRFTLRQETNAYAVLPSSQWRGFFAPPPAPCAPEAGTWGAPLPIPDALTSAAALMRQGDSLITCIKEMESDPHDRLANALAGLGRAILGRHN